MRAGDEAELLQVRQKLTELLGKMEGNDALEKMLQEVIENTEKKQAVLEALGDHRDLSLHSLLVDASVGLVERGVVTSACKRVHRGRMDIAEGMGTRRLFDFLHENPAVNMEPSSFVHDPDTVAQLDRFVAINSALEIDLTGQVTAESLGPRQVAGIGGQFDFVLAAARSRGGARLPAA